jgi:phospholipid/cholesterol/gamma-HCH transport system substrate-binding protein
MNNMQQTARVGLFFLLGLALTWVTFETLSGGKVFKDQGYHVIAAFETLKELKEGDEVRMAGVKIGEVERTRLAGGRRPEAVLRIGPDYMIKADATASIIMAGLLGTNYIGVTLGTDTSPDLEDGAEIKTKTTPDLNDVMSQIGDLGKKLEDALGDLSGSLSGEGKGVGGIIQKVDQLVTENRENIQKTTANLQSITDKVNKGEGTLGKLINDTKLHDDLLATLDEIKKGAADAKSFVANAQSIIDQVKAGKGAIGALVFDQKAGDDLKASIANLRSVSDKISNGEGTLGKLLSDDSMLRDAQAIMKKADRALDGLDDTGPITAVGVIANGLF